MACAALAGLLCEKTTLRAVYGRFSFAFVWEWASAFFVASTNREFPNAIVGCVVIYHA